MRVKECSGGPTVAERFKSGQRSRSDVNGYQKTKKQLYHDRNNAGKTVLRRASVFKLLWFHGFRLKPESGISLDISFTTWQVHFTMLSLVHCMNHFPALVLGNSIPADSEVVTAVEEISECSKHFARKKRASFTTWTLVKMLQPEAPLNGLISKTIWVFWDE